MAEQIHEDELAVEQTQGFKVGEKKTLKEYQQLDQNDESLRKWKESLLGAAATSSALDPSDPRKCIIRSLALEVAGRPDVVIDLSTPQSLATLADKPFTIKEGATFRVKVRFSVQHEVLAGLKYLQVVKRLGISSKTQEMVGSYAPSTADKPEYEKKLEHDTAPSGMMARGHYTAVSKFVDDDKQTHLQFAWSFDIKKDW